MFFKVIYYLIGIGIVLYELGMLGKFKDYVNDSFDFLQWNKSKKEELGTTPKWDDYPPDIKEFAKPLAIFFSIEVIWMLLLLFTFNWLAVILYFIWSFIMKKVWYESVQNDRSGYANYLFTHKVVLISFIIFTIVNTFHLHINLFNVIFGF